jgi:hypothetical protein
MGVNRMGYKTTCFACLAAAAPLFAQVSDAPPTAAEQQALTEKIKWTALRFRGQLPDFICMEIETRGEGTEGKLKKHDSLEMLVYFTQEGHTGIKLLKVDGKPARKDYEKAGGAMDPEFLHGAILPTHLFGPKADPQFEWKRWDTINGRRMAVLAFRAQRVLQAQGLPLAFHGLVYADPTDGMVLRLEVQGDVPPGSLFDETGWDVDYGPMRLSGRELILPVKAVTRFRRGKSVWRNEMQFTGYRKYEADSTVTFEK